MYWIKVIQSISGLAFAGFSTLHLAGHLLSNFSFRFANQALFATRELFQIPLVEITVIGGSLLVHTLSSAYLFLKRPKQQSSNIEVVRLKQREIQIHRYSGYMLAAMMIGHISATRIMPLVYMDDPSLVDLTIVTHSFEFKFMFPYYILLGTTGLYHTFYGIVQSLNVLKLSRFQLRPGRWLFWLKVFTVAMISTTLALSGTFETIFIPLHDVYGDMLRKMYGSVGIRL